MSRTIAERLAAMPVRDDDLVDGWMCPICKSDFHNQYACGHDRDDVAAVNKARREQLERILEENKIRAIVREETRKILTEKGL